MARRPFTLPKPKTGKPVAYELIDRASPVGEPMYQLLGELVEAHHRELREARIALAWALAWKPDVDGRVKLGMCKKASDLDRELAPFDVVVLLRKLFWTDLLVSDDQRRALLDHELTHATLKYDEHGEPAVDERGRKIYRLRGHDIEEFASIVERHGCYKRDLEQFARALLRRAREPFVPCLTCQASLNPGWVVTRDAEGEVRLVRCACYLQWAERHAEAASA